MEGEGAVKVAEDVPAANGEEPIRPSAESVQENLLPGTPQNPGDPSDPKPPLDRNEIFRALEVVERDSTAIAESFASLFSSLRLALSEPKISQIEDKLDAEAETSDAEKKGLKKSSVIKDKANLTAKPG